MMKKVTNMLDVWARLMALIFAVLLAVIMLPYLFGMRPYIVVSSSMEPVIHVGSLAYIQEKDTWLSDIFETNKEVRAGTIVAYHLRNGSTVEHLGQIAESSTDIVTHRVIGVNHDGTYTVKGDANRIADQNPIDKEQIIGTYKFSIPSIGRVVSKHNICMCFIIVALLNISTIILKYCVSENAETSEAPETKRTEGEKKK